FLKSFVGGIDPFEYSTPKLPFPGYSLFYRHSRGTSRSSGTYFVPGPVEKEVAERNNERASDSEFYVFDDSGQFNKLEDFLSCIRYSVEEISDSGMFKRSPLSKEEIQVITDFAKEIGIPCK
ncbi:MAG: hypothetical protein Q7R59_02055, partial [bacterium]|nr:hypothetical protein [bacterium]